MSPPRRHLSLLPSDDPLLGVRVLGQLPDEGRGAKAEVEAELEAVLDDAHLLQVGELARATGKTVRALHLYEQLGLIQPARRSKGRYRLFALDAKVRIRWISKLQSLGFSLTDIQELLAQRRASESAKRAAAELRSVYEEKLEEVRENLRTFAQLERELVASLEYLNTCTSTCEAVESVAVTCSCCKVQEHPPELVAGAIVEAQ